MGYYSHCRGEITFNPPLTWREIRNSKFLKVDDSVIEISIETDENETDTEDGVLIARVGSRLVADEEQRKFYDIEQRFDEFAQEFNLSNGRASGYIVRVGEESGDVERYYFDKDGAFKSDSAHLVWSDGSRVDKEDYAQ